MLSVLLYGRLIAHTDRTKSECILMAIVCLLQYHVQTLVRWQGLNPYSQAADSHDWDSSTPTPCARAQ